MCECIGGPRCLALFVLAPFVLYVSVSLVDRTYFLSLFWYFASPNGLDRRPISVDESGSKALLRQEKKEDVVDKDNGPLEQGTFTGFCSQSRQRQDQNSADHDKRDPAERDRYTFVILVLTSVPLILPLIVKSVAPMFVFWTNVVAYLISSISISILNKVLIQASGAPHGLLLFQMSFAVVAFSIFCGLCKLRSEGSLKNLGRWSMLVVPLTGMFMTSMLALQYGTVSLFVVVRGITPLITLVLERMLRLEQASEVTVQGVASLSFIFIGIVVFMAADFQMNWIGLAWCAANILCTLASRLLERALLVDKSMTLSFASMNLLNNLLGLAPASVMWMLSHEAVSVWTDFHCNASWPNWMFFQFSGVLGITVGWYGIAVQSEVTATSMTVLQAISRLSTVILAAMTLGENISLLMWLGFALSVVGGGWFRLKGEQPIQQSKS